MDPLSVMDLVLRAMLLTGFTCFFFRPNSYHTLRWRDLTFKDEFGNLRVVVVVAVPDSKSTGYAAALGGKARHVKLVEFGVRELCVVRSLVALGMKLGVFDLDLRGACTKLCCTVKPACRDWFVFPAVEGGVLTPTKTVS